MRNRVDIDQALSRAIIREIGERLRASLAEDELTASLKAQLDQLRELEGRSPSIVPDVEHEFGNKPSKDASRGDRSRFTWRWRRKN